MVRNRAQMGENGRQDPKNERQDLENFVLHATASTDNGLARDLLLCASRCVFLLDGYLITRFRIRTGKLLVNR